MSKKHPRKGERPTHSVSGAGQNPLLHAPLPQFGALPQNPDTTGRIVVSQQQQQRSLSFSGPLPPPSVLKEYDELLPGTAKQIIEQAQEQTKHRIAMEKTVIDAETSRSQWGLVAGFVIAMTCVIGGCVLAYTGHDWAGGTIATGAVAALAGVFVYGTAIRRKEREEKAKIMTGQK